MPSPSPAPYRLAVLLLVSISYHASRRFQQLYLVVDWRGMNVSGIGGLPSTALSNDQLSAGILLQR